MMNAVDSPVSEAVDADDLNISDVIEVIERDTSRGYDENMMGEYGGGVSDSSSVYSTVSSVPPPSYDPLYEQKKLARCEIIEQPASRALRFRYECEGRSAGSIPGARSTADNKTFPTIRVLGYNGPAVVVVSCITKDPPYRAHPHKLVGKEGCKKGVCTLQIDPKQMQVSFSNLGIQCVKKKDVVDSLRERESIRVDPFKSGFAHRNQPGQIDLNAVRLCFQVFLEGASHGKFTQQLPPVISDPIYDKKAICDLVIYKLSHCSASALGGQEVILLCDRVVKDDIELRFFEESAEGQLLWEGLGEFLPNDVHKQVAISFRTPRYKSIELHQSVNCWLQLRRPSDGAVSDRRPFEIYPPEAVLEEHLNHKKRKIAAGPELTGYLVSSGSDSSQEIDALSNSSLPTVLQPARSKSHSGRKKKISTGASPVGYNPSASPPYAAGSPYPSPGPYNISGQTYMHPPMPLHRIPHGPSYSAPMMHPHIAHYGHPGMMYGGSVSVPTASPSPSGGGMVVKQEPEYFMDLDSRQVVASRYPYQSPSPVQQPPPQPPPTSAPPNISNFSIPSKELQTFETSANMPANLTASMYDVDHKDSFSEITDEPKMEKHEDRRGEKDGCDPLASTDSFTRMTQDLIKGLDEQ